MLRLAGVVTVLVAGLALPACGDDNGSAAPESEVDDPATTGGDATTETSPSGPDAAELCTAAELVTEAATVESAELAEISGVAVSRRYEGLLWVHNDSGATAEIFAIGGDGGHLGRFTLDGAEAYDWEDMTLGQGPQEDLDYLYLADIGDNFNEPLRQENTIKIYRVAEPPSLPDGADAVTDPVDTFDIRYADGDRDAETLLADPLRGDLFIVSKQWDGTAAGVYQLPTDVVLADQAPPEPVTLDRVAEVPDTEGVFVTGGDMSVDGTLVALRSYDAVWLFDRDPDESVAEALGHGATCEIEVDEPQGETVAFAADGNGFVTISEGEHQPINWHLLP